ncbi:polysaccharide deacetylase family protein [Aureimonas altamirensis]|uniref:polysaccharide deacetylase family protein n=1 Tax=Aureimonas altamirensis TaxID=370622 RepID=UPI001E32E6E3|nr:polysaccharide deacetylase family protein [Aureimonas altamirensis]UHD45818.1 polysaccharide deacetylase family protein [Aureimonas altamirensis]
MFEAVRTLIAGVVLSLAATACSADQPASNTTDRGTTKLIALTYDDGPTEVTPRLLDVLKAHNAKATFFPNGANVQSAAAVVRRIAVEGHAVGNHTISHSRLTSLSLEAVRREVEDANALLAQLTGQRPVVFRPPYAAMNDAVTDVVRTNGLSVILWSIYPERLAFSASTIRNRVVDHARDGDIVFLHDTSAQTVDATEAILSDLSAKGFEFVTVPELIRRRGKLVPGHTYETGRGGKP